MEYIRDHQPPNLSSISNSRHCDIPEKSPPKRKTFQTPFFQITIKLSATLQTITMHHSTYLTTLLLPLLAASTPLFERGQTIWGQCAGTQNSIVPSAASDYALTLTNGQNSGICQGFLDNLHGTCGDGVTNWNCNSVDGTAKMAFTVPVTCQGWQIQNTVWVASQPHIGGVECSWTTWWPQQPDAGDAVSTALDVIFEGAGALLGA